MLENKDDLAYMLEHVHELVIKEAQGVGGYGMLVGPTATKDERERFRQRVLDAPERYIAQPTLRFRPAHLFTPARTRPAAYRLAPILTGKSVNFVPGGLTRVALREGSSLVVNSSQVAGSGHRWVVD